MTRIDPARPRPRAAPSRSGCRWHQGRRGRRRRRRRLAAIAPRSFLAVPFPPAANLATAPRGVAFDACPPVFEYTSVSSTRTFTLRPLPRTWSSPPAPMSYAHPSPPTIHTVLRTSVPVTSAVERRQGRPGTVASVLDQRRHSLAARAIDRRGRRLARGESLPTAQVDDGVTLANRGADRAGMLLRFEAEADAETELGVVLEQAVAPRRTATLVVGAVRSSRQVAAVDAAATGGVGDQQVITEQLGQQLEVRGLAAAGARAAELEQRLAQTGRLHRAGSHCARVGLVDLQEEVPRDTLDVEVLLDRANVDALRLTSHLSCAGQHVTHSPQPVQSSGATWIVTDMPGTSGSGTSWSSTRRVRRASSPGS